MSTPPTRIALVDDHTLVRNGLVGLVNRLEGYEVVLEAEDGLAECFDAVDVIVGEVLLGDGAALVRVHVVALKAGGDELGFGAVRQQVAGELVAEELVVRHVGVEGVDDPVAPQPHVPAAVDGGDQDE